MFAVAVWDKEERRLVLARDRFGEKPLLVHESDKGVLFASELRPIAALLDDRAFDPIAVADFLPATIHAAAQAWAVAAVATSSDTLAALVGPMYDGTGAVYTPAP